MPSLKRKDQTVQLQVPGLFKLEDAAPSWTSVRGFRRVGEPMTKVIVAYDERSASKKREKR